MSLPSVARLGREVGCRLGAFLRDCGIGAEAVRERTEGPDDLRNPLTPTRAAAVLDDPATLLVRLFFCRQAFPRERVAELTGPELLHDLTQAGVLLDGADVLAPFHLRIVRGLYLFSDYLGDDSDAVMGGGETTAILYQAALPLRRIGSVLDLGCGAGTLALLLAREAERAIGTDVNPRAVALAGFNAALNGLTNAQFRTGDLYGPVQGETFDLIVSQPPYYPIGVGAAAGRRHIFLHGGERGDELTARVLTGLPARLAPPGRGLVFTSWPADQRLQESSRHRILRLTSNRRELHGTRQSIEVVEHAPDGDGWSAERDVPADAWGHVQSWRIDQILHAESLLHGPQSDLLSAKLSLPQGAALFEEGGDLFLRCPPESLTGFAPIDERTWRVIAAVDRAPNVAAAGTDIDTVRDALRRGLLV